MPDADLQPASDRQLAKAVAEAAAGAAHLDDLGPSGRGAVLDEIAIELERAEAEIVELGARETALGEERLRGELARTCFQLRSYAAAAMDSEASVDPSGLKPELVRDSVAIGPVAVFGAGNFPLAFGALGTDTAAALAAGCPVVVKGHPGHPETSERCARAAREVLARYDLLPALALLHGGAELGISLVSHPGIAAVAFTGSAGAGRALIDAAAQRPDPIPVYAEMGSVNPVLVTQAAIAQRGAAIAAQLTGSVLGSAGQLCTKPGVLLAPTGAEGDEFVAELGRGIAAGGPFTLLNDNTAARFSQRLEELRTGVGVRTLVAPSGDGPALFEVELGEDEGATAAVVAEEAFGPAAIVVRYRDPSQVERLLPALGGQLTFTVHGEAEDAERIAGVLGVARRAAGRLVWNDVPTGVAVAPEMHHGGPWPASNSHLGSVGPEAIWRFRRPVTWQGFPAELRPSASMHIPGGELA